MKLKAQNISLLSVWNLMWNLKFDHYYLPSWLSLVLHGFWMHAFVVFSCCCDYNLGWKFKHIILMWLGWLCNLTLWLVACIWYSYCSYLGRLDGLYQVKHVQSRRCQHFSFIINLYHAPMPNKMSKVICADSTLVVHLCVELFLKMFTN